MLNEPEQQTEQTQQQVTIDDLYREEGPYKDHRLALQELKTNISSDQNIVKKLDSYVVKLYLFEFSVTADEKTDLGEEDKKFLEYAYSFFKELKNDLDLFSKDKNITVSNNLIWNFDEIENTFEQCHQCWLNKQRREAVEWLQLARKEHPGSLFAELFSPGKFLQSPGGERAKWLGADQRRLSGITASKQHEVKKRLSFGGSATNSPANTRLIPATGIVNEQSEMIAAELDADAVLLSLTQTEQESDNSLLKKQAQNITLSALDSASVVIARLEDKSAGVSVPVTSVSPKQKERVVASEPSIEETSEDRSTSLTALQQQAQPITITTDAHVPESLEKTVFDWSVLMRFLSWLLSLMRYCVPCCYVSPSYDDSYETDESSHQRSGVSLVL